MASENGTLAPSSPQGNKDPVWREPVRGSHPDPSLLRLPGQDQLIELLSGRAPAPPISRLTGLRLGAAGQGTASFLLPLSEWLTTSQGPVSIGVLSIAADAAAACAIQTELPAATLLSTSELSLRMLSPVAPGRVLTARGRVISRRHTIALAEVSLHDEDAELVAHGSSICVLSPASIRAPIPPSAHRAGPSTPSDAATHGTAVEPDPYLRSVRGTVLDQEIWESLSGLEVLRAQLAGELPAPPIHHLTGLTLSDACEGETSFTMAASGWLCAPLRGRVQGGFVAMLAEAALSSAIQTRLPPGIALAPIDLKVNYLRPLPADGQSARADGRVVNLGRRVAVAEATVLDGEERPVAVATGSALLLPGRPAALRGASDR